MVKTEIMDNNIIGNIGSIAENALGETVDPGVISRFLKDLPEMAFSLAIRIAMSVAFLIAGLYLIRFLRHIVKAAMERTGADRGVIQFVDSFLKIGLTIILVLMIAIGFGLDAATVVAMLGSAGVAFALALQGSLSNCAGGLLILMQKLYVVGDYISDGSGAEGTVKEISLFYTKILTNDGKSVTLPNGNLANSKITNFTATPTRRIEVNVGISYDSDIEMARKVILKALSENSLAHADPAPAVLVSGLSDSSIDLMVWVWVDNADFVSEKAAITEIIKNSLDKAGITIPFPQMDIHMK